MYELCFFVKFILEVIQVRPNKVTDSLIERIAHSKLKKICF